MASIVSISIVAAIVWAVLTALSYWHWRQVGKRLDEPLVLPTRMGMLLLPAWTVRAWITVSWLPRRRLRQRIKELKKLERNAGPETRPEILARLQGEIARLEKLARRRKR